ncbi:hypothetical protein GCM10007981_00930 [Thermocladium modestius]|uniref:Methyltransferase type 11 domain-containing protein n=1 Tax=Thermocladium modestius TaxID=62609 RepID=A0A830GVC0_9CREN|nr:methyltransferase domain-containing protein [Thermocladium modestius]GGP19003.1 hypothetical protein GCM10007981_00930 [Thermocladium modestius]
MCNIAVIEFFHHYAEVDEFKDKVVLEIGSKYVNGSVRPFIEKFLKPKLYIGIDLEPGLYVDIVTTAEAATNIFGVNRFDVVISTEVIEHVYDWQRVINAIKEVLKPGGYIYI